MNLKYFGLLVVEWVKGHGVAINILQHTIKGKRSESLLGIHFNDHHFCISILFQNFVVYERQKKEN